MATPAPELDLPGSTHDVEDTVRTRVRLAAEQARLAHGDRVVVDSLDLELLDGSSTAVVGPNGCGESTLLEALGRLLRPTSGQVVLDGEPQQAQDLVTDTETLIAQCTADHPQLAGQTAAVAGPSDGQVYAFGPTDPRSRLLTDLGMLYPPAPGAALPDAYGGSISAERVDLLDLGS